MLPLLAVLRVDDNLERQAEVVERTLLSETSGGDAGSLSRWQTAVDRLGSPRFDERRRADMQLRRDGHRALTYLKSLDRSQLTAEQRLRIRRIVDDLQDHRPDTPRRVAAWLVSDRDVWLALSQRGDEEQRALAASYLRRLRNEGDASTPTIRIASQSQPQGR